MSESVSIIFTSSMLLLGAVLIVFSWNSTSASDNNSLCLNNSYIQANKAVLCLGTALVALSFAYFGCSSARDSSSELGSNMYISATAVLGLLLFILGIVMQSNMKSAAIGSCPSPALIWVIGLFMLSGTGAYFYYERSH